jgi:hypothetical protein
VEDEENSNTDIRYASGHAIGPVTWEITEKNGAPLNAHALALFVALTELYLRGVTTTIKMKSGEVRIVVSTTARKLVEMVYGPGAHQQREYELLGLLRDQESESIGGLQRLSSVSIKKDSTWINWRGEKVQTTDDFRLIDWIRRKKVGRYENIQIALSSPIQEELINDGLTFLSSSLMQELGPKRGTALRVAVHALSQAPLPGTHPPRREIGLTALVSVVNPAESRRPDRYPGRYRGYVMKIADQIQAADAGHEWRIMPAKTDPLGKLVCADGKPEQKKSWTRNMEIVQHKPVS